MGSFGKWHFLVCAVVFLLKFPVAWHQMSIIFIGPPVSFECIDPLIKDACSASCPGYSYNRSIFTETIITEWNLVCDRSQWANLSQTIFMLGILVGNILFGSLADKWVRLTSTSRKDDDLRIQISQNIYSRYGRRNPLVVAVLLQLVAGVAAAFVPWFWLFCVLRFLLALATGGTMVTR